MLFVLLVRAGLHPSHTESIVLSLRYAPEVTWPVNSTNLQLYFLVIQPDPLDVLAHRKVYLSLALTCFFEGQDHNHRKQQLETFFWISAR